MMKRRILSCFLAMALVLSLCAVPAFATEPAAAHTPRAELSNVEVPSGYSENDYLKLHAFLEIADANGTKNGTKLNPNYDPADVSTWGTSDSEDPSQNTITWQSHTLSDETQLIYLADIAAQEYDLHGELDLSGLEHLGYVNVAGNKLTKVDVSNSSVMTLNCNDNMLTELELSGCVMISDLDCDNNQLTALNIPADSSRLSSLHCSDNLLTSLDLSNAPNLAGLFCENNQLTSLNLSGVGYLFQLDCSGNKLTELASSDIMWLMNLDCADNLLTKLDISGCIMLSTLTCENNRLEELILTNDGKYHVKKLTAVGEGYVGYATVWNMETNAYENTVIATPAAGNSFAGWYEDSECTTLVTLEDTINVTNIKAGDAMAYYAKFMESGGPVEDIEVPKGYNVNDYTKLYNFLETVDYKGVKNGFKMNPDYDPEDADTWGDGFYNIQWTEIDGEKRLYAFNYNGYDNPDTDYDDRLFGTLDLSDCTELDSVDVGTNNLTKANFSGASKLMMLVCSSNQLTELDLTGCPSMFLLMCDKNQLTELDVSSGSMVYALYAGSNKLKNLDVTKQSTLFTLYCEGNQLTELDLTKNKQLYQLNTEGNPIEELDLRQNKSLATALIGGMELTELDVSSNAALQTLWCQDNNLTELDVSACTELMTLLCNDNQLTELDLTANIYLSTLHCSNNDLGSIDVSRMESLQNFRCSNTGLTELDVSRNASLKYLQCADNGLTELDISGNVGLMELECSNNDLTKLDVSMCTGLSTLSCAGNNISEIDVSQNVVLWGLDVRDTLITDLDLSLNTWLYGVSVDPVLKELDLSATEYLPVDHLEAIGDGRVGMTSIQGDLYWQYILTAEAEKGFVFQGWYEDSACTELVSEDEIFEITGQELPEYYAKFAEYDGPVVDVPKGYNTNDYSKLWAFLETADGDGIKNGTKMNPDYDSEDPDTWGDGFYSIQWTEVDGEKRLYAFNYYAIDDPTTDVDERLFGTLDLSDCTELNSVDVSTSNLTKADFSGASKLMVLQCSSNQLTKLDLTDCTSLYLLMCDKNQLTELDLSDSPLIFSLYAGNNRLTKLDVTNLTTVHTLFCDYNQIDELDVTNCKDLFYLNTEGNPIKELDISKNKKLANALVGGMELTELDVSANTGLQTLWCYSNKLTELDVSMCTELMTLLCYDNLLTELDLTANIYLSTLYCSDNNLGSIDVSLMESLQNFRCNNAGLTELDVSRNTSLKYLHCADNALTELDVSNNVGLLDLHCSNNKLTGLDVTMCSGLNTLSCAGNDISEIDVSKNVVLWGLDVRGTLITELDLSVNTWIYGVSIDPVLKELDLSATEYLPVDRLAAVGNGRVGMTSIQGDLYWQYILTAKADEGVAFVGWYEDSACTKLISTEATLDITGQELPEYYAKFGEAGSHEHITELRNAKEATCTEDGYTGDLVCTVCGEIVETGEIIPANCPSKAFTDLNLNQWYHEYTDYVLANGLMNGMGNNKFAPETSLTRGMLVTTLYRLAGEPEVTEMSSFTDVRDTAYYADAVAWAQDIGVVMGITETTFCPEMNVTREQAATFLYRYVTEVLEQEAMEGADLSIFKDAASISEYARVPMAWAVAEEIFEGFPDNTMQPRGSLTRAQMAKLLTILDQNF